MLVTLDKKCFDKNLNKTNGTTISNKTKHLYAEREVTDLWKNKNYHQYQLKVILLDRMYFSR